MYSQNTQFSATGWNSLQFTTPFNWDGSSNVLIEITYDNLLASSNNVVAADTTAAFKSGLINSGADRDVAAVQGGHIDIPLNSGVAAIDSFITVSFWAFGNPALQPQDGTCFEAYDSLNQRVINAHVPWSNSNVYWDAGNSGGASYDRINKPATVIETEGQWNYWTFTKDVATGSMKVYLNGVQWHSGTAMSRTMDGIAKFRLAQSFYPGSQSYAGRMDEFTVFNKVLTPAEIQSYMMQPITSSDTNFSNLVLHFTFDDGNNVTAADSALGNHAPAMLSGVQNALKPSSELTMNFTETKIRPQIIFEQGVYTSYIDSVLVLDSALNIPFEIMVFNDSIVNPGIATDTITGWPVAVNGVADSTIYQSSYDYYNVFPEVIRYELARYITPYGNGLNLGTGWTWTFDVSDYVTLLHDSVHLAAGNWQELLDVQFLMIVGIPPRDVISIENVYTGNFDYGHSNNPIESHLVPVTVNVPANAAGVRWKSRVTGHGMDTPQNCAEFCPKNHFYIVDSVTQFTKLVWRDNCDLNPLYPQGGTWVYDRANWCPGAEVWTYDFELTPHVTPGTSAELNHDVQAYTNNGEWSYYQIEDQVVYYSAPNFTLDACLENVISPSKDQMWSRKNAVCMNPVIVIKNTGSTTLTTLTITYGMGSSTNVYTWTGSLAFLDTAWVTLPPFTWVTGATDFTVTLSAPNGGTDQYAFNNTWTNLFTYPPVMPYTFVIEFKTNTRWWENGYELRNSAGVIVHSRAGAAANTTYRDTLILPYDCYEFRMWDSGEDGLSWWANTAQGTGYIRFKSAWSSQILKSWQADFGGEVYMQFTVGLTNGTNDIVLSQENELNVYPNPTDGHVFFDFNLTKRQDGVVEVFDLLGNVVYTYAFTDSVADSVEADLSFLTRGMYLVVLTTGEERVTKKLLID
ncbi:MAG TPA: peptide-N-glycosidase F-related protein [Bacteroidia bacterium]|nr:peptide-N-glycosidase F-related protein [Bacteroidia bacterium]